MRLRFRLLLSLAALLALPALSGYSPYGGALAGPTALAQSTPGVPGNGSRTYPETGKTVRGIFLDYWDKHGGLAQQGYPISDEMQEKSDLNGKTYTVQYFERAVFELHPENAGTPYEVLLSQLGTFQYRARYPSGAAAQRPNSSGGSALFKETGKRLGGKFLDYWQRNGGLAQQGYPISDEFAEKSALDGKTYTVQYFERAVFELHPENAGTPYEVLLSQLGTFQYKAKYASAGQLPANLSLNDFYEQAFLNLLLRDPESFTAVGLPSSYKPDFRHNKLTAVHDAYQLETYSLVQQYLDRLRSYDRKAQSPQQVTSTSIMEWHLDDLLRGRPFMHSDYPINPVTGIQNNLQDLMVNLHPFSTKQHAEDYVARLQEYGRKFEGVMEQMRLREQAGVTMPRWMLQYTVGQLRGFASQDARQNELYTHLKQALDPLSSITPADKQTILASAEKAIREVVYPAYNEAASYLSSQESKARTTDGIWALPNGDAYYRYLIHHYTSTDLGPEEIHNLGLKEVTRIRAEMQTILDGLGYKGLSFQDAMGRVAQASGLFRTGTESERRLLLDAFREIIDSADKNLAGLFDIKPRIGVEVRAVPPEKEAGSPGGFYFPPALDGSRPGIFYVNLGRPSYPRYQIPTLAYHEAIPGHHFQLGVQSELKGVPTFQRSGIFPPATGYVEGWALYAEQLAFEAGFYKDDPHGNLGRLQAELFRSARLVVDSGIHWKKWTREQANKYMEETLGTPPGSYAGEVTRYIAWPGQALAYKIGQLSIVELRDRARKELGAKFNVKEFHNVLLASGTMPLDVLEQAIVRWIASQK